MSIIKAKSLSLIIITVLTAGCSGGLSGGAAAAAGHVAEGEQLMNKGDYRNAVFELNRAIKADPKNLTAYLDRSTSYAKLGEFDNALRDAQEVLSIQRSETRAYLQKAIAELGQKNTKAALADLEQVQAGSDKDLAAQVSLIRSRCFLAQHNSRKALDELAVVGQPTGKVSQDLAIQRILCQVDAHQYGQAAAGLQQLLKESPENAKLYAMLGAVYSLSGDKQQAINQFRQAVKFQGKESLVEMVDIAPMNCTPAALLASVYLERSPSQATIFISDLSDHRQLEEEEQFQLARAYVAMGQDQRAIKLLTNCLSSVPDDMSVRFELIRLYKKSGLPDKAREIQTESMAMASSTDKAALTGLMR